MSTQLSYDVVTQFGRLHFQDGHRYLPLPPWAQFFLQLGSTLATFRSEKNSFVAALALPTRSYAAPLIGSGFSCTSFFLNPDINEKHVESIVSLPNGTRVRYLSNGKLIKAIKQEVINFENKVHIGLMIEGDGNKTIYIDPKDANRVELSEKQYDRLPMHQKGRDICPPSKLLNELLLNRSYEYVFRTRVEGVVVSSFNSLKNESETALSVISEDGMVHEGFIHELFRLKGLQPASCGHRFLLRSAISNVSEELENSLSADSIVIFDGALGFTKWKEYFPNHSWIVLLDHTEPNFQNAVSQINQEYIYRSNTSAKILFPSIPSGIEMMFFLRG
jgi:hypothetical protein